MATASFVEEGLDRFQHAFDNVQDEIQRLRKDLRTRRRKLEREAEKRVKKLRSNVGKSDVVKRAETLRKDLRKQVDEGLDAALATFRIATKSDVRKIDRKLNAINRKLKELESRRRSASASS